MTCRYALPPSGEARSLTAVRAADGLYEAGRRSWSAHGSVELGISVALPELGLGVVGGNAFGRDPNADWLVFVAQFASIVLMFLTGAEVDPDDSASTSGRRSGSAWCPSSARW
jgi:hypothetical protein